MISLNSRHRADAVISGGFPALLLAAGLSDHGMHVIVLLHDEPGCPSDAAVIWGSPALMRIREKFGLDEARRYTASLSSQLQALIEAHPPYVNITTAFLFARTEKDLSLLEAQYALMQELHLPVQHSTDVSGCPFPVRQTLLIRGQVCADIRRWMSALRRQLQRDGQRVLSHRIVDISGYHILTTAGELETPLLVFAGEKPLGLRSPTLLSLLESRLSIHAHLTAAQPLESILLPLQQEEMLLLPSANGADFLWDGGRVGAAAQKRRMKQMEHILSQRLPDWMPAPWRVSHIVISSDGLPVIGTVPDASAGMHTLFSAGYDDHGVLGAMHASAVLMRLILGHASQEDRQFPPSRFFPGKQQSSVFLPLKQRLSGTPACPLCRHRLRFGELTDCWECVCCGSAFDLFGHVKFGPAQQKADVSPRLRPV